MAESSFDVVSKVDLQEVKNAIGQAMKELDTRYDLKGTGSKIELVGEEIVLTSADEYKIKAVRDVLEERLVKRSVPLKALTFGDVEKALDWTEVAFDERRGWLAYMQVNPVMDPMRGNPRFEALVKKMKL